MAFAGAISVSVKHQENLFKTENDNDHRETQGARHMNRRVTFLGISAVLAQVFVLGCSSGDNTSPPTGGTGGSSSTGGSTASGGSTSSGGSTASGGSTGTGGSTSTGGTTGSG